MFQYSRQLVKRSCRKKSSFPEGSIVESKCKDSFEEVARTVQPRKERFLQNRVCYHEISPTRGPHKCTMGRIVSLITESASTHCSESIKAFWKWYEPRCMFRTPARLLRVTLFYYSYAH